MNGWRGLEVGDRFNYLTIVELCQDSKKHVMVECDCGTVKRVWAQHVKAGNIKTCGCRMSAASVGKANGFNENTFKNRLSQYGYSISEALTLPVKTSAKTVCYQGQEYKSLSQLATVLGISKSSLCRRLANGWSLEEAVEGKRK